MIGDKWLSIRNDKKKGQKSICENFCISMIIGLFIGLILLFIAFRNL